MKKALCFSSERCIQAVFMCLDSANQGNKANEAISAYEIYEFLAFFILTKRTNFPVDM